MKGKSIVYGDQRIHYTTHRHPARMAHRVAIHVEPDGRVIVDAPLNTTDAQIRTAVTARARWIYKHVSAARIRLATVLPREYVSGESLLFLGRRYRLRITLVLSEAVTVQLKGGFIEVQIAQWNPQTIKAALCEWYCGRARTIFLERLEQITANLRWIYQLPPIRVRAMKRQWGSCSPQGRFTLNPYLVRASRECIDYVLWHELCHLRERNHSPRFYRLLSAHLPQWQHVKVRLDTLANSILNV